MEFTQEELQNIRHLYGASCNISKKISYYMNSITDKNATEILEKISTAATDNKDYLCSKL